MIATTEYNKNNQRHVIRPLPLLMDRLWNRLTMLLYVTSNSLDQAPLIISSLGPRIPGQSRAPIRNSFVSGCFLCHVGHDCRKQRPSLRNPRATSQEWFMTLFGWRSTLIHVQDQRVSRAKENKGVEYTQNPERIIISPSSARVRICDPTNSTYSQRAKFPDSNTLNRVLDCT